MNALWIIVLALQIPSPPAGDRKTATEVETYLESARRQLSDERRSLEQRGAIALEAAGVLDREAQAAGTIAERRSRSQEAVKLLDEFDATHPGNSLSTPIRLQSAVLVWADGRRESDAARVAPNDPSRIQAGIARLDEAIRRLKALEPDLSGADPLVAQNGRFRLAQSEADRAALELPGSKEERVHLDRSLEALNPMPAEHAVVGFAHLLKSEIFIRLGRFEEAEVEIDRATKAKEPPDKQSLAETRTAVLIGQRQYADAVRFIETAGLDAVARDVLLIRIHMGRRKSLPPGRDRVEAEVETFSLLKTLRNSDRTEARLVLMDIAREIEAPSSKLEPEAWESLAAGALALGRADRACRLLSEGAEKADSVRRPEEAAAMRFRAGAIHFQAARYLEADAVLTLIWSDKKAGPIRSKAGMLRALALGRALAAKSPGADWSRYIKALADQIKEYPDDPASGEARWLMGTIEADAGRMNEAVRLWSGIEANHPRGLVSRLAIADHNQRELDDLRLSGDPAEIRSAFRAASDFLKKSQSSASSPDDAVELDFAQIRLDLTPDVGRYELARATCDRLRFQAGTPEIRRRAQALRVVALAMAEKYAEAEEFVRSQAADFASDEFRTAVRLLDHAIRDTESEVFRLRASRVLRIVADGLGRSIDPLPQPIRDEFRLRILRAHLLTGDPDFARRSLAGPNSPVAADLDGEMLRCLADTFVRLDGFGMASEIERLRSRRLKAGSLPWIESRYRLALALFRDRKSTDAARLIDATAILHPDLGGGGLREKFEKLRRRIDSD